MSAVADAEEKTFGHHSVNRIDGDDIMRAFTFAAALGVLLAIAPRTFAAEAQTYLLLDYATPAAGQDAAYAAWLDDQRVPNMLRAAGMVNAQLFILADVQNRPRQAGVAANIPQPAKYLTVYTLNKIGRAHV